MSMTMVMDAYCITTGSSGTYQSQYTYDYDDKYVVWKNDEETLGGEYTFTGNKLKITNTQDRNDFLVLTRE